MASEAAADAIESKEVTLYWLNQSRAQRIVWLLEELQVPYDIEIFQRQNMQAPKEGKKIHPLGKFPMCKVGDHVLAESGLITEVLVEKFGPQLRPDPSDETEMLRYRYFMHYAEGSLVPPMVFMILFSVLQRSSPFFIRPVVNMLVGKVDELYARPTYKNHFDFLEKELEEREFLCAGKLTGADILLSYPLLMSQGTVAIFTRESYPKLYAYTDRLKTLESYKRAEKKTEAMEGHPPEFS